MCSAVGVKGSLSAGHVSWTVWETVMETGGWGEVRRPTSSSGVLGGVRASKSTGCPQAALY